jgi:type II secretory pathway pseudopilin PulG
LRQDGFTYLGALFVIALLGLGLAAAGTVWKVSTQRDKERQLLWVGHQYRQAIERYYLHGPAGVRAYPRRLEDLLEDRRGPEPVRHLRRMYPDPMTPTGEWGLVFLADGQIVGVHSNSGHEPMKKAGFIARDAFFADATSYADWRFIYMPQLASPTVPGRDYSLPLYMQK